MKTADTVCEKCGATISGDTTRQVCAACLLETGLGLLQDNSPAGSSGGDNRLGAATVSGEDDQALNSTALSDGRFGVYEIERHPDGSLTELGRGAMGVTYCAIDTTLQRKVALKIIKVGIATRSADARERFMREARAAAALQHENVATVYQFGVREETGQYFYAMELIEGETLEERVHRAGPLDARTTIHIAQQVTAALAVAEKHSLVHRDLKPSNLMLLAPEKEAGNGATNHGKVTVKIIDFGLAKALHAPIDPMSLTRGGFVGTPEFASPEQFEHAALDVRSDIYSLGATLWFALTGKTPFAGHRVEEIHESQQAHALPVAQLKAARVPLRLRSLLISMLALEPASRPSTHDLAARLQLCSAEASRTRRTRFTFAAAAILILGLSAFSALLSLRTCNSVLNLEPPDKSIAVLPFQNLSDQKQNAYFTDGVQDEILMNLAKVADLKVISRTSVMQYRDVATRNVREIAHQLGVAHILEGTVQRAGGRVKISAQLIDARTDTQVWGTTLERSLADIFAVQSEVAFNIVNQLKVKLSLAEQEAIKQKPTDDLVAYDRFARAKVLIDSTAFSSRVKDSLFEAAQLLSEATTRDPTFLRAFCQLARVHDKIYLLGLDHTPDRVAMGDEAIKRAVAINPDAGEVHLAQANHSYCAYLDYDLARRELAIATKLLPNEPRCFELAGFLERRSGSWEEAVKQLSKALELDPRNVYLLHQLSITYEHMRRFPEMAATLDRAIAIVPDDVGTRVGRAWIDLEWRADTKPLHAAIQQAITKDPAIANEIAEIWLLLAICERDWVTAERVLAVSSGACRIENVLFPTGWCEGFLARERGDAVTARGFFLAARDEGEKTVRDQPDFGEALCALGMIEAALGERDKAIAHGEEAVQLVPVEKDAINGPLLVQYLSIIYSWTGQKDLAIKQVKRIATIPSPINYGLLCLHPYWDELRGDPRFEQIVASLAPK